MRIKPNNESIFGTFVNLCLVYFITSQHWRYKVYNSSISESVIITGDAPVILLMERCIDKFGSMISLKRKSTKNNYKPRYTTLEIDTRDFVCMAATVLKGFIN